MRDLGKYKFSALILLLLVAVTFCIGHIYIWLSDDMDYQLWYGRDAVRITEFSQIFSSMAYHYANVNGRYVAHFIVQCFCALWGKTAFDICNSLVMCLCAVMVLKHAEVKLSNTNAVFGSALIVLATMLVPYGPSYMIGYLWSTTAALCWLWLWLRQKENSWPKIIGLFALSVAIGNFQEMICPGILAGTVLYAIQKRKTISKTQWLMLVGFAIGTLLIFMQNATFSWFNTLFLKPNSMGLGLIVILNFFRFFKILWVLVAYMVYLKLKKKMPFKEIYHQNALYFNILVMLILIHSSITFLFYRQVIGIEIISAIIFFRLLPENKINKPVLVLFSIVAVIIMAYSIRNMLVSNAEFRKIESDYNKSSDGVVYHDIKFSFPIVSLNMDLDTYMLKSYNQILKSQGKKPLIQYPEALKGKDLKNPKNEVIKMKAGDYLVIENKHNPPKRWVSEWIRDYYFYQWPKTDYEFNPENLPYVVIDNEDCVVAIVHQKLFYNPCVGVRFEE